MFATAATTAPAAATAPPWFPGYGAPANPWATTNPWTQNPWNPTPFPPAAPYPYASSATAWPSTYYNNIARNWPGAVAPYQAVAPYYQPGAAYYQAPPPVNTFDTSWWSNGGRGTTNPYSVNPANNTSSGPTFTGSSSATTTATTASVPTAATTTTAATGAATTLPAAVISKDELSRVVGTIDNDFTKNLLQLLSLLVERDKRLAGNYDQNAIYDIMNNSMNTNNIINNVASLLNTINRTDRLLGDNEATADADLRQKIVSSRSHIQQVGRQFYDRINQLSSINTVSPYTDRRLSLIATAIGVTSATSNPIFYDMALSIFLDFNQFISVTNNKCTANQALYQNSNSRGIKDYFRAGAVNSTFVKPIESFQQIRDRHLNLRPLDLDLAEFIATNMPFETLMSFANSMGRSEKNLDMELANLVQYTNTAANKLFFVVARKNMIQRQPKSPDDVLSAHTVEGDVFYRKMALATLLFNQYNRHELKAQLATGDRINSQPGANGTDLSPYYYPVKYFSFLTYHNVAGPPAGLEHNADTFGGTDAKDVPVMIPAEVGQTVSHNNQTYTIKSVQADDNRFKNTNKFIMNAMMSLETETSTGATVNANYFFQNALLDIVARFLNVIAVNPLQRMVCIQRAMYEMGYQSDNADEFIAELIKENESFNIVPPCATTKYDVDGLKDMARVMGIPESEIERAKGKLELCDMIVKADNQSGPQKGRLFARNGTAISTENAQIVEVQRRMDTIFRRVFSDWVINTFVLPNSYDNVTYEDFQNNVNVFDKLISNQRSIEGARSQVINKLKSVRGPSKMILTSERLNMLLQYMECFRDMDGYVHTEMVIDRVRRP